MRVRDGRGMLPCGLLNREYCVWHEQELKLSGADEADVAAGALKLEHPEDRLVMLTKHKLSRDGQ